MSNIIKCENCGCEEIDIIHKYKGYYVCPKCGRDTERLHEIEHDKEVRAKAIDELKNKVCMHFADWKYSEDDKCIKDLIELASESVEEIAEQMKAGGKNENNNQKETKRVCGKAYCN